MSHKEAYPIGKKGKHGWKCSACRAGPFWNKASVLDHIHVKRRQIKRR